MAGGEPSRGEICPKLEQGSLGLRLTVRGWAALLTAAGLPRRRAWTKPGMAKGGGPSILAGCSLAGGEPARGEICPKQEHASFVNGSGIGAKEAGSRLHFALCICPCTSVCET